MLWITFAVVNHDFEDKGSDWGFNNYASQEEIYAPRSGYLHNGSLLLKVEIQVIPQEIYLDNMKQELGFVGLKNQGATCYMNSLLQTLYNINVFREVTVVCSHLKIHCNQKRFAHHYCVEFILFRGQSF